MTKDIEGTITLTPLNDDVLRAAADYVAPKGDATPILTFYMGKNTPERKDYIMEHLVVPVEE